MWSQPNRRHIAGAQGGSIVRAKTNRQTRLEELRADGENPNNRVFRSLLLRSIAAHA